MVLINIVIGTIISAYALIVFVLRISGKEDQFKKLMPMKERFGENTGSVIHYFGYAAVPMIIGLAIIYPGIIGISIFDIF